MFAANSTSVDHEKQLHTKDPQVLHQNDSPIITSLKKIHSLFTKNKLIQEDIKDMYGDINKEMVKRNDPREEIIRSIEKESRVRILSSIDQINSNSSEIESLTNHNDSLKKEIQKLEKINETTTKKIISTENQINNNSSEIKSLISKNKDLMKELKNIDEMN